MLATLCLGYFLEDYFLARIPHARSVTFLSSVLLPVAIGTVVVLVWLLLTHKITVQNTGLLSLLLLLNVALGFVTLMYWGFALAIANSDGIVALQATVLIVALGWDLFTSGENTNKGGPRSPRHTRLLMFLGYLMLVATAVLYFSSQRSPGGTPTSGVIFQSELLVQSGLFHLGVPLVIATFILQVTYWWGSSRPPRLPHEVGEPILNTSSAVRGDPAEVGPDVIAPQAEQ